MIVKAMLGQDTGPITFDVDLIRKDLRTMIEEAAAHGKTLPVTARRSSVSTRRRRTA